MGLLAICRKTIGHIRNSTVACCTLYLRVAQLICRQWPKNTSETKVEGHNKGSVPPVGSKSKVSGQRGIAPLKLTTFHGYEHKF